MPWYAIRTVYHFGVKLDGKNVFEERVVCFEAESWREAHLRAEAESERYEKANNVIAHSEQSGYEQDGKPCRRIRGLVGAVRIEHYS